MYRTTTMTDFIRQPMDNLERGSSGVESLPYEMLFGHGKVPFSQIKLTIVSLLGLVRVRVIE